MDHDPAGTTDAGPVGLVECTRGELVESVHRGSFCIADAGGRALVDAGPVDAPVFPRSTLKPLQLAAMLRSGLELPEELLALGASSHSGAAVHRDGVRRILALHGHDETALRNVAALPLGEPEREEWLRAGHGPVPVCQDCSGKHAAMVATCVVNGWSVDDYLSLDHPLQQAIERTVTELTGEQPASVSVDGCGAPLFAVSLRGVATAYARLATAAEGTAEGRVAAAMRRFPELVGGEGRDVTQLMRAVPGLVAKDGAEGVEALALPNGTGVAIKVADGSDRARLPVALAVLESLGVDQAALRTVPVPPVLGGGVPVGRLQVPSSVRRLLAAG
ncbi:MAG: asparaginase [Cellulomonas sp. 73-145]|uniref:asparaginase n=1 Tax=Cellulomonas sp. 73-145 TaxID=1895739 RepID=UPI00092B81BF|nr:asparaginase [Cellulomonas sp. 73-145]OJV58017.1 MAG: asparaginase [Cellulomonas sp. 73-145]